MQLLQRENTMDVYGATPWCLEGNCSPLLILILLAFITGNSSLDTLLEGLLTQIHIDLS